MNIDDDTVDSLRKAFASDGDLTPSGDQCPPTGQMWDAARGELPPEATRDIVRHLRSCPSCAAEWRAAMVHDESPEPGLVRMPRRRPLFRPAWIRLAAAAVLVLGIGIIFVVRTMEVPHQTPVFRTTPDREIRSLVPENAGLPRDRFLLQWSAIEKDAAYTLKVDRRDLTPVTVVRNLAGTEYLVPAGLLEKIPSGEVIVWRVEAHLANGRRVTSPAFLVRLE